MNQRAFWRSLAGLLLLSGPFALASESPHALLADKTQCERCHVRVPREGEGPGEFRKDIVSLCLDCHRDKDLSSLHPIDIRPGVRVPADLPLDEHGTVTCATCHDPHGSRESDEPYVAEALYRRLLSFLTGRKKFRTFFLRRRNDEGQLCLACHKRDRLAAEGFHIQEESILDQFAGSQACSPCHPEIYREWQKTPHARMARNATTHPSAILADFDNSPPFSREAVVYVLGSHWTQRYVVAKGDTLYVKSPIWSIVQEEWDTSYWVDKPWTQYCQGCHTTGFEMKNQPQFVELGIGCEACHGPARAHAQSRGRASVVNPARLAPVRYDMVCEACHTTGHDRTGQFRFPLGYLPGEDLTRYYKGLLPKPGQDNETFSGDGTYADRHRQWLYWVDTFMDVKGLTCDVCKNFRSQTSSRDAPRLTPSEYCLTCHRANWSETEVHAAHGEERAHCHQCHVPARTAGGERYSIHDHKFLFEAPEPYEAASPRDSCPQCHPSLAASQGQ